MKVSGVWIESTASQKICRMLTDGGHQALFVGGCVRNALLGAPINDIDIATDALPERVIEIAHAQGLKLIPTGISHGTVTVISGFTPFEITTFRRDTQTDGRHASVSFSTDLAQDAMRRDFTMNALYARADGTVVDPLNGMPDLLAKRVRFVGRAEDRITEDYLRILRFFRFHAWYGDPMGGIDPEGLAAAAEHIDGLTRLSHERVGAEMLKLLTAPDPAPSVAAMRSAGVLQAVLPGSDDRALAPLIHLEGEHVQIPDPLRRLACLGGEAVGLKLSNKQARYLNTLREEVGQGKPPGELSYRHGRQAGIDVVLLRAALFEQPVNPLTWDEIEQGAGAKFPVKAQDLMPEITGPALGVALSDLELTWIKSGFLTSKQDLLNRLDLGG